MKILVIILIVIYIILYIFALSERGDANQEIERIKGEMNDYLSDIKGPEVDVNKLQKYVFSVNDLANARYDDLEAQGNMNYAILWIECLVIVISTMCM